MILGCNETTTIRGKAGFVVCHEGTFESYRYPILALGISRGGSVVAAGTVGGIVKIWDVESKRPSATFLVGNGNVTDLAYSSDDKSIAFVTNQNDLQVRSILGDELWRRKGSNPFGYVTFQNGDLLTMTDVADLAIEQWDMKASNSLELFRPKTTEYQPHRCGTFATSPDGCFSAIGLYGGAFIVDHSHLEANWISLDGTLTMYAGFPNDSSFVVVASAVGKVRCFSLPELEPKWLLKLPGCREFALNGEGTILMAAAGGQSGVVRLIAIPGGDELARWKPHHTRITAVAFAPSAPLCATASDDGEIKLWRLGSAKGTGPYK